MRPRYGSTFLDAYQLEVLIVFRHPWHRHPLSALLDDWLDIGSFKFVQLVATTKQN